MEAVTTPALVSPRQPLDVFHGLSTPWAQEIRLAYAWLSSSRGRAGHWKAIDFKKVKPAVIGIHFAQTEPDALRDLHDHDSLGVTGMRVLSLRRYPAHNFTREHQPWH